MAKKITKWNLKKCPFCGAIAPNSEDEDAGPCLREFGVIPSPRVACGKCGCGTDEFETRQEAIAAWNRRVN